MLHRRTGGVGPRCNRGIKSYPKAPRVPNLGFYFNREQPENSGATQETSRPGAIGKPGIHPGVSHPGANGHRDQTRGSSNPGENPVAERSGPNTGEVREIPYDRDPSADSNGGRLVVVSWWSTAIIRGPWWRGGLVVVEWSSSRPRLVGGDGLAVVSGEESDNGGGDLDLEGDNR
ncbi:hypothetical protein L6452_35068 [Arctium lappa]|uniref:Uncharacterized protein n=1 Tax=Arctium lappa TaxID=4217 RepID=A0ACB8YLH0_ARCLA|nr:hypothetical protein L6452_35068 [Arctium lappa]